MTVYILGAGPVGLAVAHGLALSGETTFVALERGSALGGLAQTVDWGPNGSHDLGPHKIFTLQPEVMSRVEALLPPEDWITREKKSRIYLRGHFLPYPPSPFALRKVFGTAAFLRMSAGFALARLRAVLPSPASRTFAEDIRTRLGGGLYEALFRPMAEKIWGDPRGLDAKLSAGRVQTPSVVEVAARLLKLTSRSAFEALTFRYPRGGLRRLWSAIEAKTRGRGEIVLNFSVDTLTGSAAGIESIHGRDQAGAEKKFVLAPGDTVVSTLPLGFLPRLMPKVLSAQGAQRIREVVRLNDLILVFLKIDRPSLLDESWVFVPDPAVIFHRVSEQESFDPGMTPGGSIVCAEIMSGPSRPTAARADADLVSQVEKDLRAMGYRFTVLDRKVVRLPASYPVFSAGFEPALGEILRELDAIPNFRSIGRQGAFNYIGTLDAMDIGYGAARWLAAPVRGAAAWDDERRRTRHYPVLD